MQLPMREVAGELRILAVGGRIAMLRRGNELSRGWRSTGGQLGPATLTA